MSTILTLKLVSQQLYIYFGLFIIIIGVIGGILNIVIFTSLKTFRETTCVFYLIITSIANLGRLWITILIRVLAEGFSIDPRKIFWFCKLYLYISQCFILISLTSICLATIDQCLSMSKYRHWSHLRIAHRCIFITCLVWCTYTIPFLIYANTSAGSCSITDPKFSMYVSNFHYPVIFGCLPISIMMTFSLLAYHKARTMTRRQINIIRSSRDRQVTAMVLGHVVYIIFTGFPYVIAYIYSLNRTITDPINIAQMNFILLVLLLINYLLSTGSFYVYCCVSERFRKQLIYVLLNIWLNQCKKWINKLNNNRVMPSINTTIENQSIRAGRISFDVILFH